MLRPDSQQLTGFEAGTRVLARRSIEQAHAYYHADPLRSGHARLARRSIEQAHVYYHAPFYTCAHALDGSVNGFCAPANIAMEDSRKKEFEDYITERFPPGSKRSTSGVVLRA